MNEKIISALIAAAVSLTVALISFVMNKKSLKSEREKFEKQLQRGLTEKLYDLRMKNYPKAMEITEGLRISFMKAQGENLSYEYFKSILTELDKWHCTEAAFILSSTSMNRLYDIRSFLREKPEEDCKYTKEHIKKINEAKGEFRRALRNDIRLLYEEEIHKWEIPMPLAKRHENSKI
ncbi:MAG: hypothetical protein GY749_45600 [Desulfobacteraceae bacterium]|nr:hypothetical protein [Desulfobacteraceae bacterium]